MPSAAHGAAKVAALGIGHSAAYLLGALVLGGGLWKRTGLTIVPRQLGRALGAAGGIGVVAWLAMRSVDPEGRVETLAVTAVVGGLAAAAYVAILRVSGARLSLRPTVGRP